MISYKEIIKEIKKLKLNVEDYNNDQINLQKDIKKIKNNIFNIKKEISELENKIENIDNNINNNIDILLKSDNIWYMNGNYEDLKIWDFIKTNNTLTSWKKLGQNKDIEKKLKKGDIIVWYIKKYGYNSIVRVLDKPFTFDIEKDREELSKYYEAWKHKFDTLDDWLNDEKINNYKRIGIKVEFLVTSNNKFIMKPKTINWQKKWSSGFQGSNLSKPNNEYWKEQVIEIYKYLKSK